MKANVYADNSFRLYLNGELVAADSIAFVPHNVVSVDILPAYPMTIAAMSIDNADAKTGMEYADTNIGDGGFILKLGDGTVTNAKWKAKTWRIPLRPISATKPLSAKSNFFRGAIALAVNGVPIFNPIKNDGRTDTLKAGELDRWGGHCGRADDYHYHITPVHLEKIVGKGNPIAVALDG